MFRNLHTHLVGPRKRGPKVIDAKRCINCGISVNCKTGKACEASDAVGGLLCPPCFKRVPDGTPNVCTDWLSVLNHKEVCSICTKVQEDLLVSACCDRPVCSKCVVTSSFEHWIASGLESITCFDCFPTSALPWLSADPSIWCVLCCEPHSVGKIPLCTDSQRTCVPLISLLRDNLPVPVPDSNPSYTQTNQPSLHPESKSAEEPIRELPVANPAFPAPPATSAPFIGPAPTPTRASQSSTAGPSRASPYLAHPTVPERENCTTPSAQFSPARAPQPTAMTTSKSTSHKNHPTVPELENCRFIGAGESPHLLSDAALLSPLLEELIGRSLTSNLLPISQSLSVIQARVNDIEKRVASIEKSKNKSPSTPPLADVTTSPTPSPSTVSCNRNSSSLPSRFSASKSNLDSRLDNIERALSALVPNATTGPRSVSTEVEGPLLRRAEEIRNSTRPLTAKDFNDSISGFRNELVRGLSNSLASGVSAAIRRSQPRQQPPLYNNHQSRVQHYHDSTPPTYEESQFGAADNFRRPFERRSQNLAITEGERGLAPHEFFDFHDSDRVDQPRPQYRRDRQKANRRSRRDHRQQF